VDIFDAVAVVDGHGVFVLSRRPGWTFARIGCVLGGREVDRRFPAGRGQLRQTPARSRHYFLTLFAPDRILHLRTRGLSA
jgi:hypothetical protein